MKILFLDQTGKLAGAERALLDLAVSYKENCLVCHLEDGPFRNELQEIGVDVQTLSNTSIEVRRESRLFQSLQGSARLLPLIRKIISLAKQYDLIYVNTPKALVVGAIASYFSRCPMIYHLHDILTPDHFSNNNRQLMVTLANRFATQIMAVSEAAMNAFIQAGGRSDIIQVVYNGFDFEKFQGHNSAGQLLRDKLNVKENFVIGHFSRLSP